MEHVVAYLILGLIVAFFALIILAGIAIGGIGAYGVIAAIIASIRKSSK